MTKKEEILMRNLCRQRRDVYRKKSSDLNYFKLWKRVYPDTFKNILRAMDEYAKLKSKTAFTLIERPGGLPFIVMWIGLHKLPTIQHFGTLEEAKGQYNKLTELGREPALLLDINQTEHWCQPDVKGQFKILIDDISFNTYGFHCEKIKHLTYEQHQKLSDELTKIGKSVMWTNTEEMDYLCVKWIGLDGCYPKKERNSICKILNCL